MYDGVGGELGTWIGMTAVGVTCGAGTTWTGGGADIAGNVTPGGQSEEVRVGTVWCVFG